MNADVSDSSACHTTEGRSSVWQPPWADDPRADAKDALLTYAVENPEGTPVVVAVRSVVTPNTDAGDADHRLALRFYREYPNLLKTGTRDGILWVWPRTAAFTCSATKHSPKHAEGGGVSDDTVRLPSKTSQSPRTPKENARAALSRRAVVSSDAVRGLLLDALATYRETTEDRYHRLDRVRGDGPETLFVPYSTRFNAVGRAARTRERIETAFDAASARFDRAVMVTLTSDPARYESLLTAAESLLADVSRLKSWLATDRRLGYRPPSIVVPEFTESGIPHAHIVLFGVSWIVAHGELSTYWSASRDRGEVVWFDRLESRSECGRWQWASGGPGNVDERTPKAYLLKTADALVDVASVRPENVRAAAGTLRSENKESGTDAAENGWKWWRLALYWALDMRLVTVSPSLKPDTGNDALPHVPCYEYVGTARLSEFPGYVREQAVVLTRSGGRVAASGGGW